VHGINASEITEETFTATFYIKHRRKIVHSHIKKHFPDATILHFLYQPSKKILKENGDNFIHIVESLSQLSYIRQVIVVQNSLSDMP